VVIGGESDDTEAEQHQRRQPRSTRRMGSARLTFDKDTMNAMVQMTAAAAAAATAASTPSAAGAASAAMQVGPAVPATVVVRSDSQQKLLTTILSELTTISKSTQEAIGQLVSQNAALASRVDTVQQGKYLKERTCSTSEPDCVFVCHSATSNSHGSTYLCLSTKLSNPFSRATAAERSACRAQW